MDWLFENLGKLAPVVIFLLYMISSLKGRNTEEEQEDPAAAERARKIQEEIRRKILERQKGGDSQARPEVDTFAEGRREEAQRPEIVFEDEEAVETAVPDSEWEPFRPIPPEPREVVEIPQVASAAGEDRYEATRREIAEKMKKARALQKAAKERARSIGKKSRSRSSPRLESVSASQLSGELKGDLQGVRSLRKAVLLKEVLDRPLGLR